jgi:hypothetical protein
MAENKPDESPEISSASQSSSALGLMTEVFSRSRERLVLPSTLKMSKNYVYMMRIEWKKPNLAMREGTYVKSPPDPPVQLHHLSGFVFSNASVRELASN